ncbi:MAG: ribosome small subunit-dependent GTPase A [candidate division Zixibacteria bacterium]|nr:ribosome small subunit-dependent GTPase A [candidate division Zixibacteria bacterium]
MQLIDLGWDSYFENKFELYKTQGLVPARITRENRQNYLVWSEAGELSAEVSGRFRHEAEGKGDFPTVGDWVAMAARPEEGRGVIHALLPRKSAFLRKVAGVVTEQQVIAANIDTVFIVCGLDGNYNLRRIERYLSLTWESGAMPVVLLNKADLCPEVEERQGEVESVAIGVPVRVISATQNQGLDILREYLQPGRTAAFLGSSGVGKSTIINRLLGTERLAVGAVREDDSRGRHTTTSRELVLLPDGGLVIDTPGMRELQVWGDEDGLRQTFEDIEALAFDCRFRDCRHAEEPGCAVRAAIENGTLDSGRLDSYLKLQKELKYLAARQAMKPNAVEKERWKKISRMARDFKKKG